MATQEKSLNCDDALNCSKAIGAGVQGLSGGAQGIKDLGNSGSGNGNQHMPNKYQDLFKNLNDSMAADGTSPKDVLGENNIMVYGYATGNWKGDVSILKTDDLELELTDNLTELILITLHTPRDVNIKGEILGENIILSQITLRKSKHFFRLFDVDNPESFGGIKVSYWNINPWKSGSYKFSLDSTFKIAQRIAILTVKIT